MRVALLATASGICIAGLVTCLATPSEAQELSNDWHPAPVLRQGMANFPESYMAQLFQPFRASTGPDRVLRQEDIERLKQIAAARQRASGVATFFSSDLDGDGHLTLGEFKDAQEQSWYETSIDTSSVLGKRFAKLDLDGDGTVTFEEAKAAAEKPTQAESGRDVAGRLQQLLDVDPNHDGTLTAAELEQLGRAAFAYYDRDKDGVLSKAERAVVSGENSQDNEVLQRKEEVARCMFPRAAGHEDVFFVNAMGGTGALSSVSLVGQDEVTETAEIVVGPGETPLYIVALSRSPTIWRVTGDAKRVTRLVAMSPAKAAGVTGLPKDAVTLLAGTDCISNRLTDRPSAAQATAVAFEDAIGSPVRGMIDSPRVSMKLPSDATAPEKTPARRTAVLPPPMPPRWDEDPYKILRSRRPGGLVEIDAASVVASADVAPYEVPPLEFGLMKLLQDGSIEAKGRQFYTIRKPIARLPAGLGRGNLYVFDLAPGVEPPSNLVNRPRLLPLATPRP
ncbi:EF-hand domain-containing protein [Rhizobium brockwellii]|uniref:EF-hand domain-containing protein n=1 Tax=Rhizobium brockwellii TaxID=3019932 RepID=UPI003F9913CD